MFREMFNIEIYGYSTCCNKPVYTEAPDGIGMCSYCGEWSDLEPAEEDEDE